MAWRYKELGGIRKAKTEVVRIKGRRRDKGGGGGWEKQISRVGESVPFIFLYDYFCVQMGILLNTLDNLMFKRCVSIALQHVLASIIERKIMLVGVACPKPPITIKSHNLHASNIRRAVGEIASYHKRD
jgi:hypothetical protein